MMIRPWALLLLFTSALPSSVERRQIASSTSEAPTVSGTSVTVVTSQTVAPSATITLSDSVSSAPTTAVTVTTPSQTQASETQLPVTNPSTTFPLSSSISSTPTSVSSQPSDQDSTVIVTVTSTQHGGQVATTTVFSTSISTIVVSSTNFITSTVTSNNLETATVTRYVTFTTYAKRSIDATPFSTVADRRLRWRGVAPGVAAVAGVAKRSTFVDTVTDIVTQVSDSTITVTQMVVQQTSTVTTVNVAVTSVVYPAARTTVTVESTLTVTSTSVYVGATTVTSTAYPSSTTVTPPATSTSTSAATADAGGLSLAAKAGIGAGAGAFVLLLAIVLAIVMLRKRRRNRSYHLAVQSPGMAQYPPPSNPLNRFNDLGSMTAHHGLAELDLRQPTIPDEAVILGTVARKPVVHNNVGETTSSPPPRYEAGKSAITGAIELPMPDDEVRYPYGGQPQSRAARWSEPELWRTELDGGITQASRGVAEWSTPACGHTHRQVVSDASEDTAGPPAQVREIPRTSSNSRPASQLNERNQPGRASRYLHQPLQAFYEMTGDQPSE
ncbi:hypothetical protein CONLIGDRAFT_697056 [Coniochaeta ligniaria NRRL 30616]|uniref:Mid2 domain-containing protein n=1 Tax=Coniochaeta ligniaria NRRL 30616 TaxID=1408157 RepID=A0A1J7K1Z6_9PEZI|nr:hypothetical protein CONLIGDRAFT_697056 [Coniochaeta ligniaria NRRL 30616]